MALSRSLATIAAVAVLSLTTAIHAQQVQQSVDAAVKSIETLGKDAAKLREASKWNDFRAKVTAADEIHQQASNALAEQRKALDEAQRKLDAVIQQIERPQVMIQAILFEVPDLDDAVLKAACTRVNAERMAQAGETEPVIYSVSSEYVGRLLATIEKRRPMQVISRPSILAIDGQIAEITVGQQVKKPVSARRGPKDEVVIEERDETVGLVVSLTPTIQDNRQMRLQLAVNNSALKGESVPIFVNADGSGINSPIIEKAKMQTTLQIGDGRTVLVAVKSKKPADETEPTKSTLILLTPRIVDDRTAKSGEILHH